MSRCWNASVSICIQQFSSHSTQRPTCISLQTLALSHYIFIGAKTILNKKLSREIKIIYMKYTCVLWQPKQKLEFQKEITFLSFIRVKKLYIHWIIFKEKTQYKTCWIFTDYKRNAQCNILDRNKIYSIRELWSGLESEGSQRDLMQTVQLELQEVTNVKWLKQKRPMRNLHLSKRILDHSQWMPAWSGCHKLCPQNWRLNVNFCLKKCQIAHFLLNRLNFPMSQSLLSASLEICNITIIFLNIQQYT